MMDVLLSGTRITLDAILFFHRITDNRMPIATQSHIHRFEQVIGKKGVQKRIHLITTMWDEIDTHTGEFREIQLKTEFWKAFINEEERGGGANSIFRFKRSFSSAWEILNPIVGSQSEDIIRLPFPYSSSSHLPHFIFDNVFPEELEDENDLEALEQIHQEQKGLLERLQSAIQEQGGRQMEMLREVVVEGKKVSGRLGLLLNRFKR